MRLDPARKRPLGGEGLDLAGCYKLCRQVEKAHSRTYYFSTRLFPAEVRPRVHALYAFMRYADEIVDTPHDLPLDAQLAILDEFEAETMAAVRHPHVAQDRLGPRGRHRDPLTLIHWQAHGARRHVDDPTRHARRRRRVVCGRKR